MIGYKIIIFWVNYYAFEFFNLQYQKMMMMMMTATTIIRIIIIITIRRE